MSSGPDPGTEAGSAGAVFAALADPTRRRVLALLANGEGLTTTRLAAAVGVTRQAVAKHVAILVEAGLVTQRRVGREALLEYDASAFAQLVDWLREFSGVEWDGRLQRLQQLLGGGRGAAVPSPTLPLTGGCNCGAVRYEVSEPLLRASWCHCTHCQRRSGSSASPQAHPAPGSFRITSGTERLRSWTPDGGGTTWFCSGCGSSVYGSDASHHESVGIRMGTFDQDPGIRPDVRQFVADAASWDPIPDDGLPRHAGDRHASPDARA